MKLDFLDNFDFTILEDLSFKEDSVREELIAPLLKFLGYTPSGQIKVIRSKPLTHPFVYIGTKEYKVNIIPDYLLEHNGNPIWVIDAKRPTETIISGPNVEQAYSYAIHPEIRANLYCLINGKKISLFNINKFDPIFYEDFQNYSTWLPRLIAILSKQSEEVSYAQYKPKPDFGLHIVKMGLAGEEKKYSQIFMTVPKYVLARINDDLYSISGFIKFDEQDYCITFDFSKTLYQKFLTKLPEFIQKEINSSLTQQPYTHQVTSSEEFFILEQIGIHAEISLQTETVKSYEESFIPFIVRDFI